MDAAIAVLAFFLMILYVAASWRLAGAYGRSRILWTILGVFAGPFTLPVLACLGRKSAGVVWGASVGSIEDEMTR